MISAIVVLGNAFELAVSYVLLPKDPFAITMTEVYVRNFLTVLSVFPAWIPALNSIFYSGSLLPLIVLWQIAIFLLGTGIVLFKNWARKIFIVMCGLHVGMFFLGWSIFHFVRGAPQPPVPFIFELMEQLSWILPLVYIFILTRPKVKALFK